jgi:CRISPR-associated protein Csx17
LLGTGFNDGRLEFTNNYMQRLLDLVDPGSGDCTEPAMAWWEEACFSAPQSGLQRDAILGQFDPGATDRPVNPWDYVFMLEGALAFATAAVKRLESATKGALSYPFCVRSAGIGYGSAATSDESSSRAEIWLPLWSRPCTFAEIQSVLSEGRAQVHGRSAINGIDFARAVSTLGTDRGIEQFIRFGFHARNGLAYFAVPLGRFRVQPQPQVNLLAEIDRWLDGFRRAATGATAPSRVRAALRHLESAILELCKQRGSAQLQNVLIALGQAEAAQVVSSKWTADTGQRPVPLLSPQWLLDCDDASSEFRLAASLASMHSSEVGSFRQHLEPVVIRGGFAQPQSRRWVEWSTDSAAMSSVVWGSGELEDNLIAVLQRRNLEAMREARRVDGTLVFSGESLCPASLGDIGNFLRKETDDARLAELAKGLVLLDWSKVYHDNVNREMQRNGTEPIPDAIFGTLKLCHSPWPLRNGSLVRLDPSIVRLAAAGRIDGALAVAARRLIGAGLSPVLRTGSRSLAGSRRICAALLFPLSPTDFDRLARSVLRRNSESAEPISSS